VDLQQFLHVHFFEEGAICRRAGAVDRAMDQVDATLARFGLPTLL
jgi:hypothetical protein